jgi:site-specific DNA recombinase
MMYGDELYPGEHPRLIDESTFRHAERILAGTSRELRLTGTNPDYVLRGLLRCGLCGEAMCPGSTTKKNGKTYRFYRCSKRDKHGKDRAPEAAARGRARGLRRAAHHRGDGGRLAGRARRRLAQGAHRGKREAIEKIRADLPGRVASASVAASKLHRGPRAFEGRARELVEAKLRAEADRLDAAERQLRDGATTRLDLELADREAEWIVAALRDFARSGS